MRRFITAAIFLTASAVAGVCAPFGLVVASIYGPHDSGGRIASTGARLDPSAMTCAHRDLRFGTKLYLRHGHNAAEITINDRGPFISGRTLDCTPSVGKALHLNGLGKVRIEPFPPLPRERKVP